MNYFFAFLDQPHNPMVNSGAIMSAAILLNLVKKELNIAKKFDFVLDFFKRMAGGEYLGFNNSIFLSERDSADRNFALAHFLKESDCFPSPSSDINISDLLDFYFQVSMIFSLMGGTGIMTNQNKNKNGGKIQIFLIF